MAATGMAPAPAASSDGSTSVTMGKLFEVDQEGQASTSQQQIRHQRLALSCGNGNARSSRGYRPRDKIKRFDPFAPSAGELARKMERREAKRKRELEDDAGTPLRACCSEGDAGFVSRPRKRFQAFNGNPQEVKLIEGNRDLKKRNEQDQDREEETKQCLDRLIMEKEQGGGFGSEAIATSSPKVLDMEDGNKVNVAGKKNYVTEEDEQGMPKSLAMDKDAGGKGLEAEGQELELVEEDRTIAKELEEFLERESSQDGAFQREEDAKVSTKIMVAGEKQGEAKPAKIREERMETMEEEARRERKKFMTKEINRGHGTFGRESVPIPSSSAKKQSSLQDMIRGINETASKKIKRETGTDDEGRKRPWPSISGDSDEELVHIESMSSRLKHQMSRNRLMLEELQRKKTRKEKLIDELQEKKKREAAAAAARRDEGRHKAAYFPVHKAFDRNWNDRVFGSPQQKNIIRQDPAAANVRDRRSDAFREMLSQELSRPFSSQELHEKLRYVQSPRRGHRSSYLDRHPDFAAAQLRLLREFSFWNKHAGMEGSFKPWNPQNLKLPRDGGGCTTLATTLAKDDVIVID